jgi:hypothetical protein
MIMLIQHTFLRAVWTLVLARMFAGDRMLQLCYSNVARRCAWTRLNSERDVWYARVYDTSLSNVFENISTTPGVDSQSFINLVFTCFFKSKSYITDTLVECVACVINIIISLTCSVAQTLHTVYY